MSYELVKKIRIEGGKVFVTSHSNNDTAPFREWECSGLTRVLSEQGQRALDIEILKEYEEGNFQPGVKNKYSEAIYRLRFTPEYAAFNWRNKYEDGNDKEAIEAARKSEAFNELLLTAFNTPKAKEKFIMSKNYHGNVLYLWKRTKAGVKWHQDRINAKLFNFKEEAENLKKHFHGGELWNVEQLTNA